MTVPDSTFEDPGQARPLQLLERSAAASPPHVQLSSPRGGSLVATVSGQFDANSGPSLEDVLVSRLTADVEVLVVDLNEVDELDLPGLQMLTSAYMTMRAEFREIAFRVVVASEALMDELRAAGLNVVLDCRPNLGAALEPPDGAR